jgi:tetratricopeptide (TPR) repeat protein
MQEAWMRNTVLLVIISLVIGCAPTTNKDGEALYLQGQSLEQQQAANPQQARQNYEQARDAYNQALQMNPPAALTAKLHAGLGNASYWLDDYGNAREQWLAAYPATDDVATKSFMLYRVGLCEQRMGSFPQADETFAKVQQEFPNTDAAARAREHQGYKGFTLQLATFANSATADNAIATLRRQGVNPTKSVNRQGNAVVSVGPVTNYRQAVDLKNRFASTYPQAVILP